MNSPTHSQRVLTLAMESMEEGINALGLGIVAAQQELLMQYLVTLNKWNQVYNLTAVRDLTKMVPVHVLDSLSVMPFVSGEKVLDVGSGGGLPGIPIAITRPARQVVLVDSNHKKAAFLRQAATELGLTNVSVVCGRIESWVTPTRYDFVVSRAFSGLGEFVSACGRLLAPQGVIAAMKGLYPFEEIERLPAGFRVKEVKALQVPGLEAERHLVLVERA